MALNLRKYTYTLSKIISVIIMKLIWSKLNGFKITIATNIMLA